MRRLGLMLTFILLASSVTVKSATSGEERQSIFELSPVFGLDKGSKLGFQADFNMLFPVSKNVLWGAGVGFQTSSFDFDYLFIPIYTRGKVYLSQKGNSMRPFVQLDLGYSLPLQGDLDNGPVLISPSVGVDFGLINVGLGYSRTQSVKGSGGGNALFLTLGMKFGNCSALRNSKFIKRTNLTIEGVGFVPFINRNVNVKKEQIYSNNSQYSTNYIKKFIAGGKLAWTYRINNDLSAGVGSGFYFLAQSSYENWEKKEDAMSQNGGRIPVFIRGNYKIRSLQFGKFIPYANLDLGVLFDTGQADCVDCSGIMADPTIGISMPVTERQSLNLGVGLNTSIGLESSAGNMAGFGISIGYTL